MEDSRLYKAPLITRSTAKERRRQSKKGIFSLLLWKYLVAACELQISTQQIRLIFSILSTQYLVNVFGNIRKCLLEINCYI